MIKLPSVEINACIFEIELSVLKDLGRDTHSTESVHWILEMKVEYVNDNNVWDRERDELSNFIE